MRLQNNALCLSYLQEDMNHFLKGKITADTNDIKGYSIRHTRNSIHARIMLELNN